MDTYHVLTAQRPDGATLTVLVRADEFENGHQEPAVFFPMLANHAQSVGTVEIGGDAVNMLPPVLTGNRYY